MKAVSERPQGEGLRYSLRPMRTQDRRHDVVLHFHSASHADGDDVHDILVFVSVYSIECAFQRLGCGCQYVVSFRLAGENQNLEASICNKQVLQLDRATVCSPYDDLWRCSHPRHKATGDCLMLQGNRDRWLVVDSNTAREATKSLERPRSSGWLGITCICSYKHHSRKELLVRYTVGVDWGLRLSREEGSELFVERNEIKSVLPTFGLVLKQVQHMLLRIS
jgi:hypothetical protein